MALTPLSFSIGVKDEASSQLEKINAELNNLVSKLDSIKNIAISLGGDPKEAESLMQSLNGVASSLANISKLSPEAQAASDRLTASQQKLNEATEMYNGLLAKIKASNPTQTFLDITKGLTGVNATGFAGGFKKLDPTEWAGFFRKFLVQSSDLSAKDVEGNVNQIVANIRRALSESLSNGKPFASILEEGFNFNSVNQKLNEAFDKLRKAYIKGMQELKEFETNKNGFNAVGSVIPGLQQQVEAAKKELETLKNAASTTPVNPESFKGAEGAVTELNVTIKTLGEALNKLDFSKINGGLDQLAEKLNKLITELEGVEARMKTAFTGALEANVKSLGDVIDGLAKKMAGMSTPMSEGMKQGEQATRGQTEAAKSLSQVLQELSQKYKHTAEQAQKLAELASDEKLTKAGIQRGLKVGYNQATDILDTINAFKSLSQTQQQQSQVAQQAANAEREALKQKEKLASTNKTVEQAEKELGQTSQQTAEQIQKLAQSAVSEAFKQLAASLTKIKELFDNLGKAEGLTQLNNTINGVNTAVEALAKTLSNVNNAVKFTGSTEEIASYEAKVKSLQEQVAALEAKAKGLGETAKAASEQVKTVTASGGGGGGSKDGLTEAQLKRVNDQLELLQKRLSTIEPNYNKAKELGFKDEVIEGKIKHLQDYIAALNEAVKAGSLSGIKVSDKYSLFSRAANEDVPTQAQTQKMAKQMQEYIAIQQQAQAEAERQAQAQERMRQAAEAAGMSIVKAGDQTQSAGQKSEGAKQQMHGFNEEILVNMRSWEKAGEMMAVLEKRIFAVMAQLQSGKALGFDTGSLQTDIQELMRFYAIMKEIRNNYGFANIEGAMLTTSKVLKESGLDFGQTWERNKQELTAVKTIYEQMMRLKPMADFQNTLPSANLNPKYQEEALANAKQAAEIMKWLQGSDLRKATAFVGGQDYKEATAGIEAFFRAYNQNANIAKSQTAELQRLLEKIQGTDKGGGWISVMKSAGVSEEKINEMRQLAQKIETAIRTLEQNRQMGTAANYVRSDEYRATVIEGKKANDTGYLAVREAHEQAAAEREVQKSYEATAKAAEKKREEINKAWREQDAARQKEAAAVEASMQKQMAAEEKARQKSIEDAWKAADQKTKAKQQEVEEANKKTVATTEKEINAYNEQIRKLYEMERAMSKLYATRKEKMYSDSGLRKEDPGFKTIDNQLEAMMQKLAKLRSDIDLYRAAIGSGNPESVDFGQKGLKQAEAEAEILMRQYVALIEVRDRLSAGGNEQVLFSTEKSNKELENLNNAFRTGQSELQKIAKAEDEAAAKAAKRREEEEKAAKAAEKAAEAANNRRKGAAGRTADNLQNLIDSLRAQRDINFKGLDTSKLDEAINKIRLIQEELKRLHDTGSSSQGSTGKEIVHNMGLKGAELESRNAIKELNQQKREAAAATSQLTAEEQRLAQALNQTTEHARGQSQVLSDLKMMATQYLGVWGGQQFLHNIIEIGGQLEMQRMSIGAILQNQSQANDLFERIKGLATQSPFGVVELDQMTKQLTAYGFKYNELFDMTKRLADISAATGTGVDRLALALGHVRSEAALSGYTLRQFSMGNVPLLQKLSEKLGKTTQEIRKMVRSKEISYEDVESVIKDLTNEGGMFYNMQEVISQSVKARFKNVKDAMAIMYGEMAESGIGDALKGVADALMEITKNWKDVATVVGTGAAVWGVHRAAILAMNFALGSNTAAVSANMLAYKKKRAEELKNEAMVRKLKAEETMMIATRNSITAANIRLALSNNALTKGEVLKLIALRKVSVEEAKALVRTGELTAAEVRLALQGRILGFSLKKLGIDFEFAGVRFGKAGAALNLFTQRVWASAKALLANPWTWTIAGLSAMVELWQRNSREMEKAQEVADGVYERSQNALENTRKMMSQTGITVYNQKREDITNSFGMEKPVYRFLPEFDASTAKQIMEEWSQYIRDYAATPNRILNQSLFDSEDNVLGLEEAFKKLGESVLMVSDAQMELANISDTFADAQKATNGSNWLTALFDDDAGKDLKDYENALKKFSASISKDYSKFRKQADAAIVAAREQDEGFRNATEGMQTYAEMLAYLAEHSEDFAVATRVMASNGWNVTGYGQPLDDAKKEAEKEVDAYIEALKAGLEVSGINVAKMTPAQQQAALLGFKEFLSKAGVQSKKAIDYWIDYFTGKMGIEGEEAGEKTVQRLADWQKRAADKFTVNQEIKVKTKTITSIDEFAQAVQKDLKEKQEYIDRNASHIRHTLTINAGIKFNMKDLDVSQLDRVIIQLAEKVKKLARDGRVDAAKSLLSVVQDELLPFRDIMKSIEEDKTWLKGEGYPEKDPTKDKSKNKSGSKTYKDPVAEEWKERIRLLKDANSLYKEWNKRVGEDEALNKVRQQYGDIFEQWRTDKNLPWKDFKAEDIIEYRKYIQKIVDEAQSRYNSQRNDKAKNYGKEAEAVLREGKKLLDDIDKYDFDEKAREFKTSFEKALDDITRRWEIFNSVRSATGDKMLAFDMAGISQGSRDLRNAADALKRNLADEMQRVGGGELIAKIPFSIDIDEEKLRDQFKAALGDSEKYATTIDGLVEAYKKWQKLQQDVAKSDIDVFSKLIGSVVSYSAQIRKINDELAKQKISIAESGASQSQQQQAVQLAESQADWKKMKLSADYSNLYNKTIAMSRTEFENAADAVQRMIDKLRDLGAMSPDEYLQEVDKLNKARMEWSTSGFLGERGAFGNFISGGNQGLMDYYQQRADAARRRADYLKDVELVPSAAQKSARAEAEHYQKLYEALKKLTDEAQKVVTAFQTLQQGIDLLGGLFDSLGMDGAANAMSDAGGILGGALQGASSLSALGPYGMAAGAAVGLIGGIAQVHDKALERHINKLREDVRGIEANTELIVRSRERTLGYDMGDVRRQMAQQYATPSYKGGGIAALIAAALGGSQQNKSMYDYYMNNSQGTGYEQEYANLVEQREKYMEILKDQQDKKKKSNEEIEETKSKIAELDDQIMNFSQDLAKELWGIDIKGWADQLSDALASAFENGENMAKAYRDTVTNIIQQMMQKMMQIAILEPMFERLQKQLFGENGKGGVFDPNNPKGSMSKVTKIIGDYFGKGGEGEKAITASMEFMTAFQRGMQNAGLTVLNEASNTLSSGIQGTSEETSDLLAGYVNALRQDVSVNRILLTQYVTQLWPQYIEAYTAQVTSVSNIDNNVRVIMEMMQLGNGAMYEQIAAMRSRIDNIVMGIDRVSVR